MASSNPLHDKEARQNPYTPPTPVVSSYFNPISPFFKAYDRFARWRAHRALPQPGTVENLQKEVKGEFGLLLLIFYLVNSICRHTFDQLHI